MTRFEFFQVGDKTVGYDISLDESIGRSVFSYLITIAFFALIAGCLATIVPSILIIIYYFNNHKPTKILYNIVGLLTCVYFLIDCTQGWICYKIFISFKSDIWFNRFIILNMGLLFTNAILLIYNYLTRNKINSEKEFSLNNNGFVFVIMLFLIFIVSTKCFNNNIIKKYVEPPKSAQELKWKELAN